MSIRDGLAADAIGYHDVRRTIVAAPRLRWLVVAAALLALAIAAAPGLPTRELLFRLRLRIAVERMVGNLRADHVPTARFSAIPTTQLRSAMRAPTDIDLATEARAGHVLAISAGATSPHAVAATTAALAVSGKTAKALPLLERAVAEHPAESRLWNDLAAARLETDQPLDALVAVDAALRIDPLSASALHNRALILERLGLIPVAADAWRRCLAVASDTTLAPMIQERLQALEVGSQDARWKASERELRRAATDGDQATVDRLVREFPRQVRSSAESPYLAGWAEASRTDSSTASQELRIVRTLGEVLRRRNETLTADAVRAIDDAIEQNDRDRIITLANGHLAYDQGRLAYRNRDYQTAERLLRDAARAFARGRSPMTAAAQASIASLLLNVARTDEAHAILTDVLAAAGPRSGHRGLVAGAQYSLAIAETYRGRWNAAADAAKTSAELYHELGESSNAAGSDAVLAAILDFVGQRETGWEHRVRAFRTTAEGGDPGRLLVTVGSGARAAMRAGDRELALSLLDVEMALAARVRDPLLSADLLTRRVLLQHERNAIEDRQTSLNRARIAIASVTDAAERAKLTMELDVAEAIVARERTPLQSADLFSRAIAFSTSTNRRFLLPGLLLERGRAHLAAQQPDRAAQDFSAAIDELELQRENIQRLDLRARTLDAATNVFEEAIALQVRQGNAEEAFRLVERARARALLDVLDHKPAPIESSAAIAAHLQPGTLLLEYAVLEEQLVVFAIRHDGLRMHSVRVRRDELPSHPDLAAVLLGSVRDEVASAERLIIIPDGILQRISFAALSWNGSRLVASHVISVAPSASRLAVDGEDERDQRTALIVGNPAADSATNLSALPAIRRELATLGDIYPQARVLVGSSANRARFIEEAPRYDIIHFAGHGLSNGNSLTASLVFTGDDGAAERMETSDIAQLKLTRRPLVVLSACGTLRGRTTGVEGMPSLARAFISAGASAVVGTLDDIDDVHTANLLSSFHRHLATGAAPADALRAAQLEAITRGDDAADPKNWSPFVVYTTTP